MCLFIQFQEINDFQKVISDANSTLNGFSGDFVGNYSKDIDDKLVEIGDTVVEEVNKITDQLNDAGLNSSLIGEEFYKFLDFYNQYITQVFIYKFYVSIWLSDN